MSLKNFTKLFLIALVCLGMFSCTSYKNVPYFKDLPLDSVRTESIENFSALTIQPGDLLGIHVTSQNAEASNIFNYNLERTNGTGNLDRTEENAVIGYLVDQQGNIHLPLVGEVQVKSLSTLQASQVVEAKLLTILKTPKVNIRIQNFKISVLGDVKAPGTFNVVNERITITEALSRAGDLNITGIRNILLVREVDGKRQYVPIDMNSKKVFTSPYYYLKNNDVLYVTPNHARAENDGSSFQRASLLISLLSVVAIILTR